MKPFSNAIRMNKKFFPSCKLQACSLEKNQKMKIHFKFSAKNLKLVYLIDRQPNKHMSVVTVNNLTF